MTCHLLLSQLLSISGVPDSKILAGIGLVALFIWKILQADGQKALKTIRRFFLLVFSLIFLLPYMTMVAKLIAFLDEILHLNNLFNQTFRQYKGSDWADGLLSASFFFIYIGFLIYLWLLENKASKPPPEKPLKIEAKFGNSDPPKD